MAWRALPIVLALGALSPIVASGTAVTIRVLNVADSRGVVRVALCRESEWPTHECSYGANRPAISGVVEVTLEVPPGAYGVLVHHDANGDGIINRNWLGLPTEGIGFSKDASLRFGFPAFVSVQLSITGERMSASVSLLFEPPAVR